MRRNPSSTITKPSGQCFALDRSNPIAQGLIGYWPFTEGAGRRIVNLATGMAAKIIAGNLYTKSWAPGKPGLAYDLPENTTGGEQLGYLLASPSILTGGTMGGLIKIQALGASFAGCARLFAGGGMNFLISSAGTIDQQWRVDFVSNTAFFRASLGQFTAGDIRSCFATWKAGNNPQGFTALWPSGKMTEITYNDRGATGASVTPADTYIASQIVGGAAWGPTTLWWLGMWNRPLRLDEMNALHADPWQMIYYPRRSPLSEPAVGGWASRLGYAGQPGALVIS